jgi:hypothetical protein
MDECSPMIKQKILEKRKTRKRWQTIRSPQDKAKSERAEAAPKQRKTKAIQTYLQSLTATEYSLWRTIKRQKRP